MEVLLKVPSSSRNLSCLFFPVVPVEVSKISCDDYAVSDDSARFPLVSDATPPTCSTADLHISHTPKTSSTNLPSRRARKKSLRAPLPSNPETANLEDLSHQPIEVPLFAK